MVIVGAGECGVRAALTLRQEDYNGSVTLVGIEPHVPYERPPLSKHAMSGDELAEPKAIVTREELAGHSITLIGGIAVDSIDRASKSVQLGTGARILYDKLLLATGASPRALPLADGSRRCLMLRTFDDALAIRRLLGPGSRLAVIGGGFIGLEIAASAVKLGAKVTVVEAQPRILMRGVPAEIAAVVHRAHVAAGVEILCGSAIAAVGDRTADIAIDLSDGRQVLADFAVVGIGAMPNTALAAGAGLALENGIAVDTALRTGDLDIFAGGDCCSFPVPLYGGRRVRLESWRNAQEQGALAARNMLGAGEAHGGVPWFWSDQYELGLQIAGLTNEGTETVRRDLDGDAMILFHLAADGRMVAASGIGPGASVGRDIKLAEMLIERRAHPPRERLAAADVKLKSLLTA